MELKKDSRPKIGLGILVVDEDYRILLGKRKDCGKFGIPGGYLERFENWRQGASRELNEEVGLVVHEDEIHPLIVYDAMNEKDSYHNVAIVLITKINSKEKYSKNEIVNKEPDKCHGWEFWELSDLNKNLDELFFPNKIFVENFPFVFNKGYIEEYFNKKLGNKESKESKESNESSSARKLDFVLMN